MTCPRKMAAFTIYLPNTYSPGHASVTCSARNSRKPRRRLPVHPKTRGSTSTPRSKPAPPRDPLLDDDDVDTTDITTYVSCPVCFNSLMVHPRKLEKASLLLNCNCCNNSTEARINELENIDGSPFDYLAWKQESRLSVLERQQL